MEEKNRDVKTVAFRLTHKLGPYATKFAEHAIENDMCDEAVLKGLLVEKWDGAVPDSFVSHEEVSRSLMGVLHVFLDFAVEEATKQESLSCKEVNIGYYVEPYYDDSTTVLVVDRETKTLLCKKYIKTYHLDSEGVERFLRDIVESIREGIDLVKKRKNGGETLSAREDA